MIALILILLVDDDDYSCDDDDDDDDDDDSFGDYVCSCHQVCINVIYIPNQSAHIILYFYQS